MKKFLAVIALAAFIGGIGAPAFANTTVTVQAVEHAEKDPKKEKKSEKKSKECAEAKEKSCEKKCGDK